MSKEFLAPDEPDFSGWISSYDGQPIPSYQMEAWLHTCLGTDQEIKSKESSRDWMWYRLAFAGLGQTSGLLLR